MANTVKITQVHEIMNSVVQEILGETAIINEDLSNVIDLGKEAFDATTVDAYTRTLITHIAKVMFADRSYEGRYPQIYMDNWTYGNIVEKITVEMPEATENLSWELEDGKNYIENTFHRPKVSVKWFNNKVTFQIEVSTPEHQIYNSFSNAQQLSGFIAAIYNSVKNAMNLRMDSLIMRTINNMIAETFLDEFDDSVINGKDYNGKTSTKAINLLTLYNKGKNNADKVTKDTALESTDFLEFAAKTMGLYKTRLESMTVLYNMGGKKRFTPHDMLSVILHAEFAKSADVYLYANTFHNEFVKLPQATEVAFWQAPGEDFEFANTSKINVTTENGKSSPVEVDGILGIMFDKQALGVTNMNERVRTKFINSAEFTNSWYKFDAGYFNDGNEQFIVFFIG